MPYASSQVGDKVVITTSLWLGNSCTNVYDHYLYIGITYLFGIGGACSRFKMWTPFSKFSQEVIQMLTNSCKGCHPVSIKFQNSFYSFKESSSTVAFELLLSNPASEDITVQVEVNNHYHHYNTLNSATGRFT